MTTDHQKVPSGRPLLQQARQLLGAKRYQDAYTFCQKVLERDPGHADAYYVMGIIAYEHRDYRSALQLFENAIRYRHPEAGPHVQAARCLLSLGLPKPALAHIERAKQMNPTDGYTLASIGATLSRLDRHAQAIEYHRRATEASPNDALSFFNLGSSLQFMGDFEAARNAYRSALRIAPGFAPARVHLTLITKQTPEENDLGILTRAWAARHPKDIDGGLALAHAIAKVNEDLGNPDEAMLWLDRGKGLVRPLVPARDAEDRASFAAAKDLSAVLKPGEPASGDGPLFIVGLPRSGTTLADRILSSHSQILSAGERHEFGTSLRHAVGEPDRAVADAAVIEKAAAADLAALGRTYMESVQAILETEQRFTDKMPINVFFVPAILAALPSARVICLRRNPADSALSIYRQQFAPTATLYRYAYDLESLANYVADFHELIGAYEQALPPTRFRVLDYEQLVSNPEHQIRALLAFSGLDFEPACLSFHTNAAPVATASVGQVRQPIYRSSIDRWKQYRAHLEPALRILRERGLLEEGA